jgi:hypothetical protein
MNTRIVALVVLAVATIGCSRQASSPTQPATKVLTSVPADGATGVRLDAAVTLDFGAVVDRGAVEPSLPTWMRHRTPGSLMGSSPKSVTVL